MAKFWRVVFAGLWAFALGTGCWTAWGLATPGDFFANGSPLVYPTVLVAVGLGAWVGFRFLSVWVRGLILMAAVGALCFHVFVPDGWWATPPPGWERAGRPSAK